MNRGQAIGTAVIFALVLGSGFFNHATVSRAQVAIEQPRTVNGCPLFNAAGQHLLATVVVKVHFDDNAPHDCLYRNKT